jgi:hypothetical protein
MTLRLGPYRPYCHCDLCERMHFMPRYGTRRWRKRMGCY